MPVRVRLALAIGAGLLVLVLLVASTVLAARPGSTGASAVPTSPPTQSRDEKVAYATSFVSGVQTIAAEIRATPRP